MVDAVDYYGNEFGLCHYTVAYVQALPSIFVILIPAQWSILLFFGGKRRLVRQNVRLLFFVDLCHYGSMEP